MSLLEIVGRAVEQDPIPVLGILLGCGAGALIICTSIIAKTWRSVRVTDAMVALKQQMLDRGMSAEEIERVMKAGDRERKK